jgi:hypothetical protein
MSDPLKRDPGKWYADFRAAARAKSPAALDVLVKTMEDEKVSAGDRLRAAQLVIENGFGKPVTAPAEEGSGENVQRVVYELRVKEGG